MTGAAQGTALAGVRVIDLTQFESGTSCTQILAWMGAEVIKIEAPGNGEQGRFASTDTKGVDSFYFILLNSNKKSVGINLKTETGRHLLDELIHDADVFIENFRPGEVERLGFGYDHVRELNPRIIYAQIKGYPTESKYASFPVFDMVAQATGGIMSITGQPGGQPTKAGPTMADTGAGLHMAVGVLAALYQRQQSGLGQQIEVSMQEVAINFCRIAFARQMKTGAAAPRAGNRSQLGATAPSNVYPCAPGGENDYIFIYTSRAKNNQWHALLDVIGHPELKDDPRYSTPELRVNQIDEIDALIAAWTMRRTKIEAMAQLGDAGVPAGAILDTLELSEDEDLIKHGMFPTIEHPVRGPLRIPGWPVKMTGSEVEIVSAPVLGQDTDDVLRAFLRLDDDEIADLKRQGIIE